jgi:alpha-L-rhamnosidase
MMLIPTDLRCEDLREPLGIDVKVPRLSWHYPHRVDAPRGWRQAAYQVLVASDSGLLAGDRGDLWDTGRVDSDGMRAIEYRGSELTSRTAAWWKVRAWGMDGPPSPWSEAARWTMGLLDPSDWSAAWIGPGDAPTQEPLPCPMLRTEFLVPATPLTASLHVSGLGFHDVTVNGSPICERRLDPALTNYDRRVCYVTHEVGSLLRAGRNAIGVQLGNGRFAAPRRVSADQPRPRGPNADDWFEPYAATDFGSPRLLLQLEVGAVDGTRVTVASGPDWRYTLDGPIRASNEYDGEIHDARLEPQGWAEPGFDDTAWQPVELVEPPRGALEAQMLEPVRVLEELPPAALERPSPTSWVADLGQAIYGVPRVVVRGARGAIVRIREAYRLWPDGRLRTEDNRTALATEMYILAGGERETWAPRFRGQGFRFAEVTIEGDATLEDVRGLALGSDCQPISAFSCSHPLLERIHRNVWWGHRNYKRSVPMEPDRDERQGWLGDPAKHAESDGYAFDVAAFYRKWLDDILLEQRPNGEIPEVAPAFWEAYHGDLVWPSVVTILPEWLYDFHGDLRAVARSYPAIVRWLRFVERYRRSDGTYDACQYGDWCDATTIGYTRERPVGDTPRGLIATAYHANNLRIAARFARLLDDPSAAERFERRAASTRAAFEGAFLDRERAVYGSGSQTSYVLPLAFDLVPPELRQRVVERLAHEILVTWGGHPSVGLVGMQWLMQTVTRVGRPDLALTMALRRTRPSWGYMVEQGATAIWERWDSDTQGPGMNSEALLILAGNLGSWFLQAVAGIELDPSVPAWRRAFLRPRLVRELDSAQGAIETVAGRFESDWRRVGRSLTWTVVVPPNAGATAWLPTDGPGSPTEDGQPLDEARGIRVLRREEGALVLALGSGSYRFASAVEPRVPSPRMDSFDPTAA